ncbi:hypothetical protein VNO77_31168 [Canavalia gladiata]|uniref:Uncharacterized protein n=1 Tax=Canavalia gladiata TaxID=3824 RepID=A0AAN9KPG4_CANGL
MLVGLSLRHVRDIELQRCHDSDAPAIVHHLLPVGVSALHLNWQNDEIHLLSFLSSGGQCSGQARCLFASSALLLLKVAKRDGEGIPTRQPCAFDNRAKTPTLPSNSICLNMMGPSHSTFEKQIFRSNTNSDMKMVEAEAQGDEFQILLLVCKLDSTTFTLLDIMLSLQLACSKMYF